MKPVKKPLPAVFHLALLALLFIAALNLQPASAEILPAQSPMAKQNGEQPRKLDRSAREVILGDCMATLLFMATSSVFD